MSSVPDDDPRDAAPSDDVNTLFEEYARTNDRRLRNELVLRHRWIAVRCASRFSRRAVPFEDLVQVAQIGVLRAVERFDPDYGVQFATFAMPTVLGELRRHFRDATWVVKVARRHKDRCLDIGIATDRLAQRLGRLPSSREVADELGVTVEEVREAMAVGASYRPASLDRPRDDEPNLTEVKALELNATSTPDDRIAARTAMQRLPERERQIVYLRYFEDLTQQEIADVMGISQVHVSRLLRAAVQRLRHEIEPGC
jgi:RNA polymerase sigma-B factor